MEATCSLIIDARERYVTRHEVEFSNIKYEIKQITIGDYAIITPTGKILAVIERKSYEDFAASLKDGRYSNKDKMLALRLATGCSVILLVEGPAFPLPTTTFGRIPYHAIESAIFHMQVRDNIQVIRTADTLGTAQMLARLVISMTNLCLRDPIDSILESRVGTTVVVSGGEEEETTPTELLTARIERSPREIARNMWSKFRGISVESADEFLARWSIADLAAGAVDPHLDTMKTAGGRKISKRVVAAIRERDRGMEAKILAEAPGISLATARKMLEHATLAELIGGGVEELAEVVVTKHGCKLGVGKATKIFECLTYKHQ